MDIDYLRKNNLIIFECISGSKAYGTNLPTSDTDLKGVFVLPKEQFYGLEYIEQVSNESQDEMFYELKRFIELLYRNNPNILEMLNVSADCLVYKHPVLDRIDPEMFLSKQCKNSFAKYAYTQIQKARGLNKKVLNPMEPERKTILDFCYVTHEQGATPLRHWLSLKGWKQEYCGLVNVPHIKSLYALYYDERAHATDGAETLMFRGVMKKEEANEVAMSSVPKGMVPMAYLSFNKDGYSSYCKDYKEYWEWVEKRNEERYANTVSHGKNYDAKNMMHTFRLLDMAEEIARDKKVIVRRPNRDFLLSIRRGEFTYEELVTEADRKAQAIDELYAQSDLPETPDYGKVNQLLIELREELYSIRN